MRLTARRLMRRQTVDGDALSDTFCKIYIVDPSQQRRVERGPPGSEGFAFVFRCVAGRPRMGFVWHGDHAMQSKLRACTDRFSCRRSAVGRPR